MKVVVFPSGTVYHYVENESLDHGEPVRTTCGVQIEYGDERFFGRERQAKREYEACSKCRGMTNPDNPEVW